MTQASGCPRSWHAEILRATPDIPTLAPIVAFEHHLRLDGTGYPQEVRRGSLNVGTMLCSIADVYAPDPHRPQVRVVVDKAGTQLDRPFDVNLVGNR